MKTCQQCESAIPDRVDRCPACGGQVSPPCAAGDGNGKHVDLRERVAADRGLIKKIQDRIPGWREYREKEDLRIADSLLRTQLADRISRNVVPAVEDVLEEAARQLDLSSPQVAGRLVREARSTAALIRHAEQGYSGISGAYTVDAGALSRMYDYDWALIVAVEALERDAIQLRMLALGGDAPALEDTYRRMEESVAAIRAALEARREVITGTGVFS
jgi:hypothetical protein